VVTASADETARIWDAATRTPIGQPMRHDGWVISAAFSPDGTRVVTASEDKMARIWRAPARTANLIAAACLMLRDHDTADLATRYGIAVVDPICTTGAPAPDLAHLLPQ
jgi:WD40 repeat protein